MVGDPSPGSPGLGTLYMAWKGIGDDTTIYYSSFDNNSNSWSGQNPVGVKTDASPSLAAYPVYSGVWGTPKLYMAWAHGTQLNYGSFDGRGWSVDLIPCIGTSGTPSIGGYQVFNL